jgi:hypothetical protein
VLSLFAVTGFTASAYASRPRIRRVNVNQSFVKKELPMAGWITFESGIAMITMPLVKSRCLETKCVKHRVRTSSRQRFVFSGPQKLATTSVFSIRVVNPKLIDIKPSPSPSSKKSSYDLIRVIAKKKIYRASIRTPPDMINIKGKQTLAHDCYIKV